MPILILLAILLAAGDAAAQTRVKFALDWQIQGPQAPFITAKAIGAFSARGLDVTIDRGTGSQKTIEQAATGAYDMRYGDMNSIVQHQVQHPQNPLIPLRIVPQPPPLPRLSLHSDRLPQ